MKKFLFLIILFLSSILLFYSCVNFHIILKKEKKFKNNSEFDQYTIEQKFKHDYKKQRYDKYEKTVIIDSTKNKYVFQLDSLKLYTSYSDSIASAIIINGLLLPEMIKIKNINVFYVRSEVILFLKHKNKIRHYRLYIWPENWASPIMYVIELTNKKAKLNTGVVDFINGSHVSYMYLKTIVM